MIFNNFMNVWRLKSQETAVSIKYKPIHVLYKHDYLNQMVPIHIYQPLSLGKIWHKVNF